MSAKKQAKRKRSKKTKASGTKKMQFFTWDDIGDKISGTVKTLYTGQFGGIVSLTSGKNVNVSPIVLARLIKRAIKDGNFKTGANISIEFIGKVKRTKIFKMIANKKVYESTSIEKVSLTDFEKSLDNIIAEYSKE